MIGRRAPVCPGGRAIAQWVSMPPRAADTNEPVTNVGAASAAGASGTSPLVIGTGAEAKKRASGGLRHAGHHAIGGLRTASADLHEESLMIGRKRIAALAWL